MVNMIYDGIEQTINYMKINILIILYFKILNLYSFALYLYGNYFNNLLYLRSVVCLFLIIKPTTCSYNDM